MTKWESTWRGKKPSECTRDELLKIIEESDKGYSAHRESWETKEMERLQMELKIKDALIEKLINRIASLRENINDPEAFG